MIDLQIASPRPEPSVGGVGSLPEVIEDAVEVARCDPAPAVLDGHHDLRVVDRRATHPHPTAARGELDRIRDEIDEHLTDAVTVGPGLGDAGDALVGDLDTGRLGARGDVRERSGDDGRHVARCRLDGELARIDRREVEQIAHELLHALGGAMDGLELDGAA